MIREKSTFSNILFSSIFKLSISIILFEISTWVLFYWSIYLHQLRLIGFFTYSYAPNFINSCIFDGDTSEDEFITTTYKFLNFMSLLIMLRTSSPLISLMSISRITISYVISYLFLNSSINACWPWVVVKTLCPHFYRFSTTICKWCGSLSTTKNLYFFRFWRSVDCVSIFW